MKSIKGYKNQKVFQAPSSDSSDKFSSH